MDDWIKVLLGAIAGGAVSGIGATISMKVDQAGIKQSIIDHERRLLATESAYQRLELMIQHVAVDLAKIKGALGVKD
jgi:hypothetical protein